MKSTANIPMKSPGPSKTPHRNYKHVEFLPFSHIRSLVDINDRGGNKCCRFTGSFCIVSFVIFHGLSPREASAEFLLHWFYDCFLLVSFVYNSFLY